MTKRKNFTLIFTALVVVFAVFLILYISIGTGGLVAEAATTPRYAVSFDYTCYYQYNTSKTVSSSGTGATSATVTNSAGGSTTISIAMYGSAASGSGTLANGGTIKSNTVNIVLTSGYEWNTMTVTNSSGTEVGTSSNKTLTLSNLADGKYTFSGTGYGRGWNPNPRAYATYSTQISFTFVVDTYVDNTIPTISGASTSSTGNAIYWE